MQMQSKDNACTKEINVFYKTYFFKSELNTQGCDNRNKKSRENSKNDHFQKQDFRWDTGDSKLLLAIINFLEILFHYEQILLLVMHYEYNDINDDEKGIHYVDQEDMSFNEK